MPDATVVGAGPNGLAAAIVLAQAGHDVIVYEADTIAGGGCRSAELTLPGFVHDICSAVHPTALASPFFRTLPLSTYGLEWIMPPSMLAHPLDDAPAVIAERAVDATAAGLGDDGDRYRQLVGRVVEAWPLLEGALLGPPLRWPRHPLALARFGLKAIQPATRLASAYFTGASARALFAGIAAHTMLPLDRLPTGAFGLVLAATLHTVGWAFPRGGAQQLANALARHLESLGGRIVTGAPVSRIEDLPQSRVVLCDLSPEPLLRIAGGLLPEWYRRKLQEYRYGIAAYKVDWALDRPIPWKDEACARAGTVHVAGTFDEVVASEQAPWDGRTSDRPFVLLSQPSLFDPTRAPAGKHTAWAYCHVPHGSTADMLPIVERQIERFAPGFRDRILARHVMTPAAFERHNPNFVGGDIGAGVPDIRQLIARPTWREYSTPAAGLYICSASTPPGVGVHGMCGYYAAKRAMQEVLRA